MKKMKLKILALAAILSVSSSPYASATVDFSGDTATSTQYGSYGSGSITQFAGEFSSSASVYQDGSAYTESATITQDGSVNGGLNAEIYQNGSNDNATILQAGNGGSASISQGSYGYWNTASISQDAGTTGESAEINQYASGYHYSPSSGYNQAIINQSGGTADFASINQYGGENEATINQYGTIGDQALLHQDGYSNLATSVQGGNADFYYGPSQNDLISVYQDGSNNQAWAGQASTSGEQIYITQSGGGGV